MDEGDKGVSRIGGRGVQRLSKVYKKRGRRCERVYQEEGEMV